MAVATRKPSIELKTKAELQSMIRAGDVAGRTLQAVAKAVEVGITTKELDRIAENFIRANGGKPTFIGYRGYPASLCVSINNEVVHGIPGPRKIKAGDVVSLDVAATVDGFVGDTATTVLVEPVSKEAAKLWGVTKASLDAAIECMRVGNRLGDVSAAVQAVIDQSGLGIVRDFVGHGIGRAMHEEPAVPNYGRAGTGMRLEPGLVLAIEPMVTLGSFDVSVLEDGWTVVTRDGSLAAHAEHTVAVTEEGPRVLTRV
jgi:methionyl aminopeptidase